jgi:hypothetical protein
MTKLKLTVNETKTRVCKLPEEKFEFGRCYSTQTGRAYLGTLPSRQFSGPDNRETEAGTQPRDKCIWSPAFAQSVNVLSM